MGKDGWRGSILKISVLTRIYILGPLCANDHTGSGETVVVVKWGGRVLGDSHLLTGSLLKSQDR